MIQTIIEEMKAKRDAHCGMALTLEEMLEVLSVLDPPIPEIVAEELSVELVSEPVTDKPNSAKRKQKDK